MDEEEDSETSFEDKKGDATVYEATRINSAYSRSSTIRTAVRRKMGPPGDVESFPLSSPRLTFADDQVRCCVCVIAEDMAHWPHTVEEGRAEPQPDSRAQEGRSREREDRTNVHLPLPRW